MAKLKSYHTGLINDLKDIEMSRLYLQHAIKDEDPEMLFLCLQDVFEARGVDQNIEELGLTQQQINEKISMLTFSINKESFSLAKI